MDSVLNRYFLEKYPLLCIAKTTQTPRASYSVRIIPVRCPYTVSVYGVQAIASVLSLYGVRIKRALRKKNVTEICFIDIKTKKTFLTKKSCLIS